MFHKYKNLLIKYIKHNIDFWDQELKQSRLHAIQNIPIDQVYLEVHSNSSPIFVLSTGRCGTKLLTDLIQSDSTFIVAHQPVPELTHAASYAYQHRGSNFETLTQIIDACRYESIRDAWLLKKTYVETNNRITFFAPYLASLFPQARFIHLQRDPYQFIESGYSRNWYSYEKLFDEGRITPQDDTTIPWDQYSQVQKIAWLWKETNDFIRKFTETMPSERRYFIDSKDLYTNGSKVKELLSFMGIQSLPVARIEKLIARPVNAQPANRRRNLQEEHLKEIDQILK